MSGLLSEQYATFYKALSHSLRLEILSLLSQHTLDVTQLCQKLNRLQPNISQHLRMLKKTKLVTSKKDGKKRRYKLNPQYKPFILYLEKHQL